MGAASTPRLRAGKPVNGQPAAQSVRPRYSVRAVLDQVLRRDERGPVVRGALVILGLLLIWVSAVLVERPPVELAAVAAGEISPLVRALATLQLALTHGSVLRHLVVPVIVIGLGLYAGAVYVDDLFELHDTSLAFQYLLAALFGLSHPWLIIKDGDVEPESKKTTLYRIGGPGYTRVHLGNAALFERPGGESVIYPAVARRFAHGFERLREVIDLRDQIRSPGSMEVYTKDGVPVSAADIQVAFRVWGGEQKRSKSNPYPFDELALRRVVYGRAIGARNSSPNWTDVVAEKARAVVIREISHKLLKELIAEKTKVGVTLPGQAAAVLSGAAIAGPPVSAAGAANARKPLSLLFYKDAETIREFQEMSVELIWIGVGTLDTPQDVSEELINVWQADVAARLKSGKFPFEEKKREARAQAIENLLSSVSQWWEHRLPLAYRRSSSASESRTETAGSSPRSWYFFAEELPRARELLGLYAIKLEEMYEALKKDKLPLPEKTEEAIVYIRQRASRTETIGGDGAEADGEHSDEPPAA